MENVQLAEQLELYAKLLDIHGANPFKSKSYAAAALTIEKLPFLLVGSPKEKWMTIRGIGNSVAGAITELLETKQLGPLEELLRNTPVGVAEMLQIKGVGPKKIHTIWKEMGIESIGELLYACQENRLLHFKGFGEKTQQAIEKAIHFLLQHKGHFLYAEIEALLPTIDSFLQLQFGKEQVAVTGSFRRQLPTLDELAFVIVASKETIKEKFLTAQPPELVDETDQSLCYKLKNGLAIRLFASTDLPLDLLKTSSTPDFHECLLSIPELGDMITPAHGAPDDPFFLKRKIPVSHPARRESKIQLEEAYRSTPLQENDIKGLIHCHSNWSDGANTIEEMAHSCMEKGWEYMVLSDHSASAFYANGLKADRVLAQHQQIDALNNKLAPFRIFKSIESDILTDGSLDYEPEVLARFDIVIASIHSNLRMAEEVATKRLLSAIENPFTSILGHPTGRLLLSREGYPIDHKKIIDTCALYRVAIEINAHPRRLDLDWQWIDYAIDRGVLISINPDAHARSGLTDVKYGVLVAQKTRLTPAENLSSFTRNQLEQWLVERKRI
ncbi:MAG: DNA polymerase/3'-5' exonuclease PolX [Bacteroidetes bacterium]|nr:DNA polymerase/3'-5' exonuclease PolX [Bacteroidota bacterium]